MPTRLQYQKREYDEATQHAIYRAMEERNAFLEANTGIRQTNSNVERVRLAQLQPMDFYFSSWSDSASQIESQWRSASNELSTLRRPLGEEFLLPSENVFSVAETLLTWLKSLECIDAPDITRDGDGSLYLEWQAQGKRLSICLSQTVEGSYIYVGTGREYTPYPLTLQNIKLAIDSFFA